MPPQIFISNRTLQMARVWGWRSVHNRANTAIASMAQANNPSRKRKLDDLGDRTFQIVVAASRKLGIGNKGSLPWKLPPDMAHFKNITTNTGSQGTRNAVVMGRCALFAVPHDQIHFD